MKDNCIDSKAICLTLDINVGEDADADEVDHLTRQLLDEINEIEVESIELVKHETMPEGAKSAEVIALGSLAITVLPKVIPKLVDFLQFWLMRGGDRIVKIKTQSGDRSIKLEYSPTAMSQKELNDLVNTLTGAITEKS